MHNRNNTLWADWRFTGVCIGLGILFILCMVLGWQVSIPGKDIQRISRQLLLPAIAGPPGRALAEQRKQLEEKQLLERFNKRGIYTKEQKQKAYAVQPLKK